MLQRRYDIQVVVGGKRYSPHSGLYNNYFAKSSKITISSELDKQENYSLPILIFASYNNNNESPGLTFGHVFFNKKTEEEASTYFFSEKEVVSISFDKNTLTGTCPLDIYNLLTYKEEDIDSETLCLDSFSMSDICLYLDNVISNNEKVKEFIYGNLVNLCNDRYGLRVSEIRNGALLYILNIVRLATTNLIEIEKVITSDNVFILESILNDNEKTLEKGKKLSRVINIPKFALAYIKEKDLEHAQGAVREIASNNDGNDLKIIFDFFDSFDKFNKLKKLGKYEMDRLKTSRGNCLQNLSFLLQRDYKIVTLLNYVLRQELYWAKDSGRIFREPFDEIKLLADYVGICEKRGFTYERYPQDLQRSHDIAVKNFKELGDAEKNDKFVKAIKNNYAIDPLIVDDFVFVVPKDINDLVLEGNNLHHCIGSYTDNIINNYSHIFFMRFKSSPEESYVTLELDPVTADLVEAKENYNKEVESDEANKALKKFVRKIKIARGIIVPKAKAGSTEEEEE